jgi:hypothetical protein
VRAENADLGRVRQPGELPAVLVRKLSRQELQLGLGGSSPSFRRDEPLQNCFEQAKKRLELPLASAEGRLEAAGRGGPSGTGSGAPNHRQPWPH